MSGVYGTFVENFPELKETFSVWKDSEELAYPVPGLYIPSRGESMVRKKFLSGNYMHDLIDDDFIFIPIRHASKVEEGYYFRRGKDKVLQRVIRKLPYDLSGGYVIYSVQRVGGTRPDQTKSLGVAEGTYD